MWGDVRRGTKRYVLLKKGCTPFVSAFAGFLSLTRRLVTQCWNSITLRRFHADRIWYENRQKPRAGALGWVVVAFEHLEDEGFTTQGNRANRLCCDEDERRRWTGLFVRCERRP